MLQIFIDVANGTLQASRGGGGGIESLFGIDIIVVADDVNKYGKEQISCLNVTACPPLAQLALKREDQRMKRGITDGDAVAEMLAASSKKIQKLDCFAAFPQQSRFKLDVEKIEVFVDFGDAMRLVTAEEENRARLKGVSFIMNGVNTPS